FCPLASIPVMHRIHDISVLVEQIQTLAAVLQGTQPCSAQDSAGGKAVAAADPGRVPANNQVGPRRHGAAWGKGQDAALKEPARRVHRRAAGIVKLDVLLKITPREGVVHDFVEDDVRTDRNDVCRARRWVGGGSEVLGSIGKPRLALAIHLWLE